MVLFTSLFIVPGLFAPRGKFHAPVIPGTFVSLPKKESIKELLFPNDKATEITGHSIKLNMINIYMVLLRARASL